MFTTFILYIAGIAAFLLFGIDKHRAMRHRRRIPESVLLIPCFLGGALGGTLGMLFFWHKVRKPLFYILVPLLMLLQLGLGWYLIHYHNV